MEQAARVVFVLGYEPSDCVLEHVRDSSKLDKPSVEIDRLVVAGKPCFEVEVRRTPMSACEITYTTTPRLIAWPAPRSDMGASLLFDHYHPTTDYSSQPAHQERARPMSGEPPT